MKSAIKYMIRREKIFSLFDNTDKFLIENFLVVLMLFPLFGTESNSIYLGSWGFWMFCVTIVCKITLINRKKKARTTENSELYLRWFQTILLFMGVGWFSVGVWLFNPHSILEIGYLVGVISGAVIVSFPIVVPFRTHLFYPIFLLTTISGQLILSMNQPLMLLGIIMLVVTFILISFLRNGIRSLEK
ncbi:MAG: hypothetical protein GY786_07195, partial [Proteobacteria bacterium]|nr:hypothetical protein [Pseudomonadota bacterium]